MKRWARGLALLVVALGWGSVVGAAERLNVVLILADDLGWTDLACYGSTLHETPRIDRLAREGVRFTRAYAASVCSPTRASLMTGKHYARLGMTIWREAAETPPKNRRVIPPVAAANLPLEEVTIAEVFRNAGYLTALVGKWHLGDARFYPENQGFDVNIGGTLWGAPATYFFPYSGTNRFGGEARYVPHLELGRAGEYLTDRLTNEALRVIDGAGDRPFFLYLAHHAPHTPIEAKPDLIEKYRGKQEPGQPHANAAYAAMIESLDASVGRVLDLLDARGLQDKTVVIFCSDNGGYINEFDGQRVTSNAPLRSGKGSLHEGGIRVPLIARWPGLTPSGAICGEPVAMHDLFPTLHAAAGLKPRGLDGVDLSPLLERPSSRLERDALYFHYPHYYPTTTPVSAVVERRWKFLEYLEDGRGELYDLETDPGETRDMAREWPDRAEALRGRLHAWRDRVGARMPAPNPSFRAVVNSGLQAVPSLSVVD